jgi:CRISPR-associated protein Csm4
MNTWRIRIRPLSPWASPWRSDTIFGSICWRWLELYGRDFETMIEEFEAGGEPPFLLSDAWPGNLLPLPAHIRIEPELVADRKKWKPPLYVSESSFQRIAAGQDRSAKEVFSSVVLSFTRVQTAINRESGTAAERQLFELDCQYIDSRQGILTVYIRTDKYLDRLAACFHALTLTGYGKKSSSGLGEFELLGDPERCEWLDTVPNANAFVALNHFAPATTDPIDGIWRTHVTYPKFHSNSVRDVFKGAIVMLSPGSVFRTSDGHPRTWYGSILQVPRPEIPKALHYALCFPAPVVWSEAAI